MPMSLQSNDQYFPQLNHDSVIRFVGGAQAFNKAAQATRHHGLRAILGGSPRISIMPSLAYSLDRCPMNIGGELQEEAGPIRIFKCRDVTKISVATSHWRLLMRHHPVGEEESLPVAFCRCSNRQRFRKLPFDYPSSGPPNVAEWFSGRPWLEMSPLLLLVPINCWCWPRSVKAPFIHVPAVLEAWNMTPSDLTRHSRFPRENLGSHRSLLLAHRHYSNVMMHSFVFGSFDEAGVPRLPSELSPFCPVDKPASLSYSFCTNSQLGNKLIKTIDSIWIFRLLNSKGCPERTPELSISPHFGPDIPVPQQHEVFLGPFGSIVTLLGRKGYRLFTANCLCQPTYQKAKVDKYDVSNQLGPGSASVDRSERQGSLLNAYHILS
ncbi:hypothetical protein K449DRAFT_429920 [Hypoxylon sp. EC38]|nr:hypothetical protein K449DRAFT_429920 [Hypoxylon sp. EC38]